MPIPSVTSADEIVSKTFTIGASSYRVSINKITNFVTFEKADDKRDMSVREVTGEYITAVKNMWADIDTFVDSVLNP